MSIHSDHPDPEIRARSNQLLREAGYDVYDENEAEHLNYQELLQHIRSVRFSFGVLATLLVVCLALFAWVQMTVLFNPKVILIMEPGLLHAH